jgi:hypothetical protein
MAASLEITKRTVPHERPGRVEHVICVLTRWPRSVLPVEKESVGDSVSNTRERISGHFSDTFREPLNTFELNVERKNMSTVRKALWKVAAVVI